MSRPFIALVVTCLFVVAVLEGRGIYLARHAVAFTKTPEKVIEPPLSSTVSSDPTLKTIGRLNTAQIERFEDLVVARNAHVAMLEKKIREFKKKDPDARAIKTSSDLMKTLIEEVAIEFKQDRNCFVGALTQEGQKQCGKALWGFYPNGEIHVIP